VTQASADVEITRRSSGRASNNDTPDHATVEEAMDAGVLHRTPDIDTENMITVDLHGHDFGLNGDVSDMQDFTPDDFSLGGNMSNTQDIDFNTWQRHGGISMTAMQTRPICMPMSITAPRAKEWDTGDILGDDL
jgi:hypothetical protein